MFIRTPGLKIRAEVRLRVRHCLLGKCEWGQIRRVYSKAQALSQCRYWLGKNLPQATLIEVVSTAAAAEFAQREPFAAAIATFEKNGVNMTWIESFPTTEAPRERNPNYLFFVDVEGHIDDENVARAI